MDAAVVEKDARGGKEEGGESKKRVSKRKSLEEEKGGGGELMSGPSRKKTKKGGEEPGTDAAVVEKDARGGKEEGGESKKRRSKRRGLEEEKGGGGELTSGPSRQKTKKVKREDDEGVEGKYSIDFEVGGEGGGGTGGGERHASGKKAKRDRGVKASPPSSSVLWSLVSGLVGTAGKTKAKTKADVKRVSSSGSTAIVLGTPALGSPAQILRPTIWAASRSELVLVLPELGHSRSYNGITQGSSNYPMVLLDESTASSIGAEIIHPIPAAADREYPCVRLTLRREFVCDIDELPVGSAVKNKEVEESGLEYIDVHPLPPSPAHVARIPHLLPPEIDILTASRDLCPIILISSKEVFDQAFLTADSSTNAGVGLADEHAYVFWGFFLIKKDDCVDGRGGGRLVASWDIEGEGQQDKRRVRGVVEWVFDAKWASGDARPWWADIFPSPPVPGWPLSAGLLPAQAGSMHPSLHANLHLNLVPTQLADGQEEGSADECMPRGWLCKKCGRLNPKAMMRHRWCGAVWMGCQDEPLSGGYAVHLDDARDPRQTPLALPINVWNENRVDVRVADWDDGMRTVKYRAMTIEGALARRDRENEEEEEGQVVWTGEGGILKHVFTCNAEDLQREATPLFARIQEEVCLSKRMGDAGMYFKCDISDKYVHAGRKGFSRKTWGEAPQSVRDAQELMEFMGRSYGEDDGFAVDQMTITGWVSSGTRKATEKVTGKIGTVGMLCLGNDVILTIMAKWIVGEGADTETMSVTLVHGDMLLFSGCDFEYSIKRLGTSLCDACWRVVYFIITLERYIMLSPFSSLLCAMSAQDHVWGRVLIAGGTDWPKLGRKERGGKLADPDNPSSDLLEPHLLRSLLNVKTRSVHTACSGCHFVCIDVHGQAWLFGRNGSSCLGVPSSSSSSSSSSSTDPSSTGVDAISEKTPRLIRPALDLPCATPSTRIVHAACGRNHTLLVGSDGNVWSAGANAHGQCGHAVCPEVSSFRLVTGIVAPSNNNNNNNNNDGEKEREKERAVMASAGVTFSVVLAASGRVYTFGSAEKGQLGNGTTGERITTGNKTAFDIEPNPTYVKELDGKKIVQIASGPQHTLAVDDTGVVYVWGYNGYCRLGLGNQVDALRPKVVPQFSGPNEAQMGAQVIAGPTNSVVIDRQGMYWMAGKWKNSGEGSGGSPYSSFRFMQEIMGCKITLARCGGVTHWAVTPDDDDEGGLMTVCWGQNASNGELGLGPDEPKSATKPTRNTTLNGLDMLDIAAGQNTTLFLVQKSDRFSEMPRHPVEVDAPEVCVGCKRDWGDPLECDKCDAPWHLECLRPPLDRVPEGEWFCAACGEEAGAPEVPLAQKRGGGGVKKRGREDEGSGETTKKKRQ
ncbi:hypothetical protein APHAL10511_000715 [Amanita phalloides]|nr:hypothetical protein APHAL10511_000715 [Amanita phalloides]